MANKSQNIGWRDQNLNPKKRKGSILIELLLVLIILNGLFLISYQMLDVLKQESNHLLTAARKREMMSLARAIYTLVPEMQVVDVKQTKLTFHQATTNDIRTIRLVNKRLIYQKNGKGYFVLCTRVESVIFSRMVDQRIKMLIHFLDGSQGECWLKIQT